MELDFMKNGFDTRTSSEIEQWILSVRANIDGPPFIYLNKPKCACSTTKIAIWDAEFRSGRGNPVQSDNPHKLKNSPFTHEIEHILNFPKGTFVFTFVRNPYMRIFSCYRDKCIKRAENPNVLKALRELGVGRREVSFIEFLKFVSLQKDADRDAHWRSLNALNIPDLINCEFVGSVENYDEDMQYVFSRIYPVLTPYTENKNSQRSKRPDVIITSEEQDLILDIYKIDFETFGYSKYLEDIFKPPIKPT